MMKVTRNSLLFIILVLAYLGYSVLLYTQPDKPLPANCNVEKASAGRLVWQKYNCQSCHQLYGLGGYLGPDLTNVYSALYKGEDYIKGFVMGGTPQMPAFHLEEEELNNLIEFLKMTDASGTSDPRSFTIENNGMINQGKDIKN